MSLKLKYTIKETGAEIKEACLKIMYFKGAYKQNDTYQIILSACIYASEQAKIDNLKPVDENVEMEVYVNADDFLKLLYEELKKQFPKSKDC